MIDFIKMHVKAGDGGRGIVAWRREKFYPMGGPAGGDGGNGGSVYFAVDTNETTLTKLRFTKSVKAGNGSPGLIKKMHGKSGDDVVIGVPLGTMIRNAENGDLLADLTKPGQKVLIAHGGKGGLGNHHFATARNDAPEYAQPGEVGESLDIQIELRLLADAGLIGFPSVGKSTFLDAVSKARPEIGDYPFTTITPNVGVVQTGDGRSFVLADLPGLIEGASDGKGLGHQFLRHIERCRVIIHVIDMGAEDGRDPLKDYEVINNELKSYQIRLLERPQIVVANKMDMENAQENVRRFKEKYPDIPVYETTTIIHEGLDPVLRKAADLLATTPAFPITEDTGETGVMYTFEEKKKDILIEKEDDGVWSVSGPRLERVFDINKLNTEEDFYLFANKMRYLGIDTALREAGCQDGDTVRLLGFEFEFIEN